ncbi:DNA polymerase III subunit chi [Orrella sp. NBD-18]|uniref:DNA polymerase III subunit chi n=1 Tax=Sheuella amnicola TaxID=2707330 RepID=A0A6B2QYW3_9BURK|nr:DNA polymerase III subunit chi [Sheuella amnicola]NDY83163.1 DNA polymerase III subunit chi [Sheuella amnicola]HBI83405.1 DNA polymerase III subunit chi [Alcaligenaceae bacterium]
MARIDFAFGAREKLSQACQTTLRQFLAGRKIIVYCSDLSVLKAFDQKLWAVDDAAFVPHVMAEDPLAPVTPVVMTHRSNVESIVSQDSAEIWLLNLDVQIPDGLQTVARVLEIVTNDEDDKATARARWRAYQGAGHDVHSHKLA